MKLSRKSLVALVALAGVALFVGFEGLRVWWFRGYSRGTRTGIVRKMSYKGPPYCKYLSGEMVLQGTMPGQPVESWEFSVDDEHETSPIVRQLHEAEKTGVRVTLQYRQDLHSLFRCTPSEYFVTGVERQRSAPDQGTQRRKALHRPRLAHTSTLPTRT
jgi:hypothetical protein